MFFQIIYAVHVEMEGKAGKHAGQKRTYRAVAEMYAFLPREAVTRFLMSCKDCQKRMHLQINPFHKTLSINSSLSPSSKLAAFPRTNCNGSNSLNGLYNRNSINRSSSKSSPADLKELLRSASLDSNALTSLANNLMANGARSMNGRTAEQRPSLSNGFGLASNNPSNPNKSSNLSQSGGDNSTNGLHSLKSINGNLTTAEYLKQINLLTKTGSMLGADLNSLMCKNGFNYLTDALSQGRELMETLSSDLNEDPNEELESNGSTPSLGIDEDDVESVVENNSNDKYLDSAHLDDHLNNLNNSEDVQVDGEAKGGEQANNAEMPTADDQQINQTLLNNRTTSANDQQQSGDERKRKLPIADDCSDFEANEAEKRPKIENRIDEEEGSQNSVKIKQEEEESKWRVDGSFNLEQSRIVPEHFSNVQAGLNLPGSIRPLKFKV